MAKFFIYRNFLLPLLTILAFSVEIHLPAADLFWTNSASGNWTNAANWATQVIPSATDRVQINNGGLAQISSTGACYSIILGTNSLDSGSLQVTTGAVLNLFVSGSAKGTHVGLYGTGNLLQNGGTLNFGQSSAVQSVFSLGSFASGSGTYTLSGGNLNVYSGNGYDSGNGFSVGNSGTGTWNVWGGVAQLRNLAVGKSGTATGVVNQTNGAVNVGVAIAQTDETRIGGATSADSAAKGTYNISGGTLTNAGNYQIGAYGRGTNNISGGVVAVGSWPAIGRFAGSVGVLKVSGGRFIQSNGSLSLLVGEEGAGQLNLSGTGIVDAQAVIFGNAAGGSGVLNLDGGNLITGNISKNPGAGTFNFNGGTLTFRRNASMGAPIATFIKAGGAFIDTGAFVATLFPNLQNAGGSLTKAGSGWLVLAGTNVLGNLATINTGVLTVDGSLSPGCSIKPGATLGGEGMVDGVVICDGSVQAGDWLKANLGVLQLGTLTLNSGATCQFRLSNATNSAGAWNDRIDIAGNLTLNQNPVFITVTGTNLVPGTYPLITYSGKKTGTFGPVMHNTRYAITLDETVPNQVNLVVGSGVAEDVRWRGAISAVWDVATTTNWVKADGVSPTTFFNLDRVLFDDTPGVRTNVTLGTNLYPAAVVVHSDTNTFVLSGSGRISGAGSITKLGTSTLTLSAASDFIGPVTIGGGTVKAGVATALGSTAGPTLITDGGALDVNGKVLGAEAVTVSGVGPTGAGAIVNSGADQASALRFVTLSGDTTFGGTGRWDIRSDNPATTPAALVGGNHTLTKAGANAVWLVGLGSTGLGDIAIKQGTLGFQTTTTPGDPSHAITMAAGTTLSFWDLGSAMTKVVFMTNASLTAGSGNNVFAGPITLTGANSASISASLELRGNVTGSGSLTKSSTGTLLLSGTNSFTGGLTASAGTLRLGSTNAVPYGFGKGSLQVDTTGLVDMNNLDLTANAITGSGIIQCTNGTRFLRVGGTGLSGNFSGRIQGVGTAAYPTIVKQGSGTLILDGTADNAWAGAVVESGTLVLGKASAIAVHALGYPNDALVVNSGGLAQLSGSGDDQIYDTRGVVLNGGTFDLNGRNETIGVLHGTNGTVINSAGQTTNTLIIGNGNGSGTFVGSLRDGAGALSITKTGTGSIALVGTNSYTGNTLVNSGWLIFDGISTGNSFCSVAPGAGLAGKGSLAGAVVVAGSLRLGDPTAPSAATLEVGSLTLEAGAAIAFQLSPVTNAGGAFNDLLNINGDLVLNSNTISISLLGADLSPGVYRLMNYTGRKTGSFAGVAQPVCNALTIDESVTNQINLVVTPVACDPIIAVGGDAVLETVTPDPSSSALYALGTSFNGFASRSDQLSAPLGGTAVQFRGTQTGGNSSNTLNSAYLIYRYRLDFDKPVSIESVQLSGVAFNGPNSVFRLLDAATNPIAVWATSGGNNYQTFSWTPPPTIGTTFYVDEYDTSSTWRYRDSIRVGFASTNLAIPLPRTLELTAGQWVGLTFAATNHLPLDYRWQFNGQELLYATNRLLLIPNLQRPQSGAYSVVASNFTGSITTLVANLSVPAVCTLPSTGIAAWWQAEDSLSDILSGSLGVLQGGTTFTNGKVGRAFHLDGQSSAILVSDSPALNPTKALTIETWLNLNDTNHTYFVATKQPSGTAGNNYPGNFEFRVDPGGRLALLHQTSAGNTFSTYTSTSFVNSNGWHHVAVTLQAGGSVVFYLDGAYAGSSSQQGTFGFTTSEPLRIGTRKDALSYFNGMLDELAIYSRALSASEIAAIYNAWANGKCPDQLPPCIVTQPLNQTVASGQNANLSVGVRSPSAVSYQWRFNTIDLPGATNSSLWLSNVNLSADGFYSVLATNAYGSVTSTPARLNLDASGLEPFYAADFENAVGTEWSAVQRDVTPAGARHFLGQFGNRTVTLSLTNLPSHTNLTASFDLFVIRSWDGSSLSSGIGPDLWSLQAAGGPVLLSATFNTISRQIDSVAYNTGQSFPQTFPTATFPSFMGSSESNSLGFLFNNGVLINVPMDSVYHLVYTWPHSSNDLQLNFIGGVTEALNNESWGLDNVKIFIDGHSVDGWPVVVTPPQSQTLAVGGTLDLSAVIGGAAPFSYQWLKDGVPLAGGTNAHWTVPTALTNDAGSYTLAVSNAFGSVVSPAALVLLPSGPTTPQDGPWNQPAIVLLNTPEAALMARSGDIDNLNLGWPTNFSPFSGMTTPAHTYALPIDLTDLAGTDRIFVGSGYNGNPATNQDGYLTNSTRPGNLPQAISIIYRVPQFTNLVVTSAALQLFVDGFQAGTWGANYRVTLNGTRAPVLETLINHLDQTGPVGNLITVQVPTNLLDAVRSGQLDILIDDPATGAGDGFGIDFAKLLINPAVGAGGGVISGRVTDQASGLPVPGAMVGLSSGDSTLTDSTGAYSITNVPNGLSLVSISHEGYQSQSQVAGVVNGQSASLDFVLVPLAPTLAVSSAGAGWAGAKLRLSNLSGLSLVTIYASSNLLTWEAIATVPFVAGTYDFVDPNAGKYSRRFYRAGQPTSVTVPAPQLVAGKFAAGTNSTFNFAFGGLPNATYTIWGSTNLVNWTVLGTPDQPTAGSFHFTDTVLTNSLRRFYRVSFP